MSNKEKEQLKIMENTFKAMKEEYNKKHNSTGINASLPLSLISDFFKIHASIKIVDCDINKPFFVMCIYPHESTIDKLVDAVLHKKYNIKVISDLWKKNKDWTIEIDGRIFDNDIVSLNEKELVAIFLHEIGHVVYNNSIPVRLSTILRFEIARASMSTRVLLNSKLFRGILSLPILDACIVDKNTDEKAIKEEIKADNYAKKFGYRNELLSAMKKLSNCKLFPKNRQDFDNSVKTTANYAINNLDQFSKRADNLVKKSLIELKESCSSPYLIKNINDIIYTFYEDSDINIDSTESLKTIRVHQVMDKLTSNDVLYESFFGKKKLKKIDINELDYIDLKINSMRTENDRMMVVSYINSKLDIVEYYESIILDSKASKKYDVPYSFDQLKLLKLRLKESKNNAFKFKLPENDYYHITVSYPKGYEG